MGKEKKIISAKQKVASAQNLKIARTRRYMTPNGRLVAAQRKEYFAQLKALVDVEQDQVVRSVERRKAKRRGAGLPENTCTDDYKSAAFQREDRFAKRKRWLPVDLVCPVCKRFVGDNLSRWVIVEAIGHVWKYREGDSQFGWSDALLMPVVKYDCNAHEIKTHVVYCKSCSRKRISNKLVGEDQITLNKKCPNGEIHKGGFEIFDVRENTCKECITFADNMEAAFWQDKDKREIEMLLEHGNATIEALCDVCKEFFDIPRTSIKRKIWDRKEKFPDLAMSCYECDAKNRELRKRVETFKDLLLWENDHKSWTLKRILEREGSFHPIEEKYL